MSYYRLTRVNLRPGPCVPGAKLQISAPIYIQKQDLQDVSRCDPGIYSALESGVFRWIVPPIEPPGRRAFRTGFGNGLPAAVRLPVLGPGRRRPTELPGSPAGLAPVDADRTRAREPEPVPRGSGGKAVCPPPVPNLPPASLPGCPPGPAARDPGGKRRRPGRLYARRDGTATTASRAVLRTAKAAPSTSIFPRGPADPEASAAATAPSRVALSWRSAKA